VVANPALLPDAVEESLRFNTSAQRFRRRLMKDVTLHGQTMKAGDFVCLAYGSGNRDERQYPDPDRYDITRKPRGHLGFGGGVHACLGTAIARLVGEDRLRGIPQGRARLQTRGRPAGVDAVVHLPQPAAAGSGAISEEQPMTQITYIEPSGQAVTVNVTDGWSLMQGATANGVDGIVGECGGSCACATCHCYVDEPRLPTCRRQPRPSWTCWTTWPPNGAQQPPELPDQGRAGA
jgi:hypothetical protein